MDEITTCPACHVTVRSTDYFCYNCGKNLHPPPPSTTFEAQARLYLASFFLPPMGIIWGWPYLKRPDQTRKIIGIFAIALSVIAIFIAFKIAADIYFATLNQARNLQNINGL